MCEVGNLSRREMIIALIVNKDGTTTSYEKYNVCVSVCFFQNMLLEVDLIGRRQDVLFFVIWILGWIN